jgi:hypothetical protein
MASRKIALRFKRLSFLAILIAHIQHIINLFSSQTNPIMLANNNQHKKNETKRSQSLILIQSIIKSINNITK